MKRNYYLMLDCETFGTFKEPTVYDLGMAIVDKKGNVYAKYSFVISETFHDKRIETAYFACKIPMYFQELEMGKRQEISFAGARYIANRLVEKWAVKAVVAHNARFDNTALDYTSKAFGFSRFFDSPVMWYDTLQMAADTIGRQPTYERFCKRNGYMTAKGKPQLKAEVLYRYCAGDENFTESHTGLEDVMCEKVIFVYCLKQHKKMRTTFFNYGER